jgi:16S rRNA (adenine1518-N6/adenine1519-N6)-dimethyltransferase
MKRQSGHTGKSGQIHQKKSLGQVFLNDDWPVRRVVEILQDSGTQVVIEIGPGGAILTKALSNAGFDVTAIEKDDRFAERLSDLALPGVEVVNCDVLEFDLADWIDKALRSGKKPAVVGNIPYNISTPIIMWLLPHLARLAVSTFLVQLEFAERLASGPNTKDYGSLSVYTQLRSNVRLDCEVGREYFTPVPKVDSAIVVMNHRDFALTPELLKKVEVVSRAAFHQRRKKLRNAVKPFLTGRSETDSPVDLNRRPETLGLEEFIRLAEFLS